MATTRKQPIWATKPLNYCTTGKAYLTPAQDRELQHWMRMTRALWNILVDALDYRYRYNQAYKACDHVAIGAMVIPDKLLCIESVLLAPTWVNSQYKVKTAHPADIGYVQYLITCYLAQLGLSAPVSPQQQQADRSLLVAYRLVPADVLYAVGRQIANTYKAFFARVKRGKHLKYRNGGAISIIGLPQYKSRKHQRGSVTLPGEYADGRCKPLRNGNYINMPKARSSLVQLNPIKTRGLREPRGRITGVTVRYNQRRYDLILRYEGQVTQHRPTGQGIIGIDMTAQRTEVGYTCFDTPHGTAYGTLSQLRAFPNHVHALQASVSVLQSLQDTLGRRHKAYAGLGRKRRRTEAKITRIYQDYYHKLCQQLLLRYDLIVLEDLDVQSMLESAYRGLAKQIQDSRFALFRSMLAYKVYQTPHSFLGLAPQYFPSSQLCSHCGTKPDKRLTLVQKHWVCPHCNTRHQRDENAAANLRALGETQWTVMTLTPKERVQPLKDTYHYPTVQ